MMQRRRLRIAIASIAVAALALAALLFHPLVEAQAQGTSRATPFNWPFCNNVSIYNATTNGSTQIVTLAANTSIYICGMHVWNGAASTTQTVELRQGRGTSCATAPVTIYPAYVITPQSGWVIPPGQWAGLKTTILSQAVCITTTATASTQATVWWSQW